MTNTDRQVRYAMRLLSEAGYSTRFMDSSFRTLGARMRERSGSVEAWLRNHSDISSLIDGLRKEKGE